MHLNTEHSVHPWGSKGVESELTQPICYRSTAIVLEVCRSVSQAGQQLREMKAMRAENRSHLEVTHTSGL